MNIDELDYDKASDVFPGTLVIDDGRGERYPYIIMTLIISEHASASAEITIEETGTMHLYVF